MSGAALVIFLDLGADPTITTAACSLPPHYLRSDNPHSELAIEWLQASFTKRDDDKFVGGPIRTRRELVSVVHTESCFTQSNIDSHIVRSFPPALTPTPGSQHTLILGTPLRPVEGGPESPSLGEVGRGSRSGIGTVEGGDDYC